MGAKQQMSQRMMKSTEDGRPFAQEFQDLFSALVTTLELKPHRVRLQKRFHTFLTRDAVEKLSALKLTSTNRRPDPKDPSKVYTTTTVTTFAMNPQCARLHCDRFLTARYLDSVEGKTDFSHDGDVWQLTPKGISILQTFCTRLGINDRCVWDLLESNKGNLHLVQLERDLSTDEIITDSATVEVIFRRFAGYEGPNLKSSGSGSDNDSLYEYSSGSTGVQMSREKKIGNKTFTNTFTGKAAMDWLMDCCTTVDPKEGHDIAQSFLTNGLIAPIISEKQNCTQFMATKTTAYTLTEEGQRVAGWIASKELTNGMAVRTMAKDSNTARLLVIVNQPALRALFREYLRETLCEENLVFYIEVNQLLSAWDADKPTKRHKPSQVRELITLAYGLYNTFLAPSSACELNIDHMLRNSIANRMSDIVHKDDDRIADFFGEIAALLRQAQASVFKLMAGDSVPKFIRDSKYASQLRERSLALALGGGLPAPVGRTGSTSSGSQRSGSLSSTDSTVGKDMVRSTTRMVPAA